jgi:hypothetical protein
VLTLALGGCVYLRLLAITRQLARFDQYFTLQQADGLRLLCREPVLLSEDFTWMGVVPATRRKLGVAEQWRVRWQKQLPLGVRDLEPRDLEIELMFADNRFTQVFMSERYFVFVPKSFFIGLVRGLGSASVDRAKREADVSFTPEERAQMAARVTTTALESLLGHPTEHSREGDQTTYRYRYDTLPLDAKGGFIDMRFTFESGSGRLLRLLGRSPVGQLSFNFASPSAPPP